MADLKRRSSKAPKPKAIITLYTKELIVMDEKSKVRVLEHKSTRMYTLIYTV